MKNAIRFAASAAFGIAQAFIIAALIVLPLSITPSKAQFADQSTWIATPGGTANAITLPVANWARNLPGVPIHFLPTADNTTAVTILVNGVGSPIALLQKNNTALTALSGGELRAGQWATIAFDGTEWVLDDPLGKYTHASTLANSALSFGMAVNLQINATVSTNALTIALKTAAGADPTATTPILIPFRDVTIANGDSVVVPVTAATSFTIDSTNTLGCVSGQMCRPWVVAINNGGTVNLCLFTPLSGTNIAPINEAALQTSASGTSGGSSAQTYYCNSSAVTAKAIRIIGYVEIQEVTAGTWATGPTYVQLFGPGIKKPGDVIAEYFASTGSPVTTTNTYTVSNTAPAPAGGAVAIAAPAVTPSAAANILEVGGQAVIGTGTGAQAFAFLYDGTATQAVGGGLITNSSNITTIPLGYRKVANSLTPITFTLYFTANTGTTYLNSSNGSAAFAGTGSTFIKVKEIMSAIEPANDNVAELLMVG